MVRANFIKLTYVCHVPDVRINEANLNPKQEVVEAKNRVLDFILKKLMVKTD